VSPLNAKFPVPRDTANTPVAYRKHDLPGIAETDRRDSETSDGVSSFGHWMTSSDTLNATLSNRESEVSSADHQTSEGVLLRLKFG
jgi:hypothetical protein